MTTPARKTPPSLHATSLWEGEIVEENDFGSMRRVTADNLPILKRLSIKRVLLNPGAMRTPHWHANANELTYCVSGTALVSVLDDGSSFASFVVTAGQMFHVDSGALHHIENIGTDVAEFIITFSSERPEDFGFGATFGAFTDAVLGNTYDLPASDIAKIHRDTTDHKLAARIGDPDDPARRVLQRPAQVRHRGPDPAAELRDGAGALRPRPVLAGAQGPVHVLAARRRGRHARAALASRHRGDGLRPTRNRADDRDESRWHS